MILKIIFGDKGSQIKIMGGRRPPLRYGMI